MEFKITKQSIAVLLVQLLIAFLIFEVGARIIELYVLKYPKDNLGNGYMYVLIPENKSIDRYTIYEYDDWAGYHVKRNRTFYMTVDGQPVTQTVDASGLRADGCGGDIWLLGDSFAFGRVSDNETIASYMCNKGYKVKNLGINGFGTNQEIMIAKEFLQQEQKPKVILMLLYIGNDLSDNDFYMNYKLHPEGLRMLYLDNGTIVEGRTGPPESNIRSQLKYLAFDNPLMSLSSYRVMLNLGQTIVTSPMMDNINRIFIPASGVWRDNSTSRVEYQLSLMRSLLKYGDSEFGSKGIRFVVFIVPTKEQVCEGADRSLIGRVANISKDGIEVYDLSSEYIAKCKTEKIFWKYDNHLNAHGNAFTAEKLADILGNESFTN